MTNHTQDEPETFPVIASTHWDGKRVFYVADTPHNDEERRQWIMNDEGLYNFQRQSRLSMREFIRQNRAEIDAVIDNVLSGRKPAHYLAYGPWERRYF